MRRTDLVACYLVIAARHAPAAAAFRVIDLSFGDTAIIMVAQGHVPRNLQRARGVDVLEGGSPLRVSGRLDAILVEVIAHGDHAAAAEALGRAAHLLGDFALVLRAV